MSENYEPIRMRLVADDTSRSTAKRCRRALKANTFILTSTNPVQQVFPRSDNRVEGWITSAVGAASTVIYIAGSQADANSQGGGSAQISGTDTMPFPVNTTDAVWISAPAAGLPVTVSSVAIYEDPD